MFDLIWILIWILKVSLPILELTETAPIFSIAILFLGSNTSVEMFSCQCGTIKISIKEGCNVLDPLANSTGVIEFLLDFSLEVYKPSKILLGFSERILFLFYTLQIKAFNWKKWRFISRLKDFCLLKYSTQSIIL